MKTPFLIVIFLSTFLPSYAECVMSGITYFPEQRSISQYSMFIVEGYALSQKLIHSFNANRKAYLVSKDGEIIDLILQETFIGQMGLTQAIFKPAERLKLNQRYFLKFSHLSDKENYEELKRYNPESKKHEPVSWHVTTNQIDHVNKNVSLKFEQTDVQYYGCGPAAYAIFQPENTSISEIWYKTEVYDENSKTSTIYIIKPLEGKLRVGHGMCSGGFTFSQDGKYKVRFTPLNLDGKQLKTTAWHSFESPFKNSKNPMGF